jgi:capsular polysaccharide transport system permease protein
MSGMMLGARRFADALDTHRRVLWALLMRELSTRYGRDNIGFLWVIAEPLVFAGGVAVLWTVIKPAYEHGIRVVPFVVTGYLPLILIRQTVGFTVGTIRVNQGLLYHRQITPLHLFIARFGIEALGISLAFIVIVLGLILFGVMSLPRDLLPVYAGWFLLAWMSFGVALMMGALGQIFEFVERFVQVITYVLIPLSGAFYMAAWLPPKLREGVLYLPFIHCFELIRKGFFGEFVTAYFNLTYAAGWAAGLTMAGLVLVQFVRGRVEVE